ncbi:MAG: bifunctional riboflavin kinase/FAD synthetase [Coriobacteriia bacterium]
MMVRAWEPGMQDLGMAVVAIGVFDGMHLGHQALLADTVALARAEGVRAAVVTFEPDPHSLLEPEAAPPRLVARSDTFSMMEALGVELVLEVPFDEEMAATEASDFIDGVLASALTPVMVAVGEDFVFGRGGRGGLDLLRREGARRGWRVVPHELVTADGTPITATRIRGLIGEGRVAEAARLLGREHFVRGVVVRGRGLGARIGVPTANVHPDGEVIVPPDAVYAVRASFGDGTSGHGVASVGTPPSFPDAEYAVEVHLIDTDVDSALAGEPALVSFTERIRTQEAFDSVEALAARIQEDIQVAKVILAASSATSAGPTLARRPE